MQLYITEGLDSQGPKTVVLHLYTLVSTFVFLWTIYGFRGHCTGGNSTRSPHFAKVEAIEPFNTHSFSQYFPLLRAFATSQLQPA
ncbi:hypothetical protein DAI22_02g279350 [Oryza sativa Japonica Group]|jgi:hypothetical protein|nr:hypothetical protein DAI22_02g279350 [Oryza sativa Japonica Group]